MKAINNQPRAAASRPRPTVSQCMQYLAALAHLVAAEAAASANTTRARHVYINRAIDQQAAGLGVDVRRAGVVFMREQAHEALRAIVDAGRRPLPKPLAPATRRRSRPGAA